MFAHKISIYILKYLIYKNVLTKIVKYYFFLNFLGGMTNKGKI
jgi:hypothetical protein